MYGIIVGAETPKFSDQANLYLKKILDDSNIKAANIINNGKIDDLDAYLAPKIDNSSNLKLVLTFDYRSTDYSTQSCAQDYYLIDLLYNQNDNSYDASLVSSGSFSYSRNNFGYYYRSLTPDLKLYYYDNLGLEDRIGYLDLVTNKMHYSDQIESNISSLNISKDYQLDSIYQSQNFGKIVVVDKYINEKNDWESFVIANANSKTNRQSIVLSTDGYCFSVSDDKYGNTYLINEKTISRNSLGEIKQYYLCKIKENGETDITYLAQHDITYSNDYTISGYKDFYYFLWTDSGDDLWIIKSESIDYGTLEDISYSAYELNESLNLDSSAPINITVQYNEEIDLITDSNVISAGNESQGLIFVNSDNNVYLDYHKDYATKIENAILQANKWDDLSHETGKKYKISYLCDYDGNLHGFLGEAPNDAIISYKHQGVLDVNSDGRSEAIYTNNFSGRWATTTIDPITGIIDYTNHGKGGSTRIVGIYEDPLVQSGVVEKDSDFDGSRTFINDLKLDNLILKTVGDYDGDGFQEVYWSKVDNTAYLRAVMHADGNIQYANYQNLDQMTNFLTGNGFADTVALIA